jgi:cell wall-associated NlpC family hydrolase
MFIFGLPFMQHSRILLVFGLIAITGTGCHLVQPLFSKSGNPPPAAPSANPAPKPAPTKTNSSATVVPVTTKSAANTTKQNVPLPPIGSGKHMAENGLRTSDELNQVQDPPELLQVKYAILLDVVAEKLTNRPLLEVMDKWWGTRYCFGGSTENCIDCSAFTQLVSREVFHLSLPRTAQEQYNTIELIEKDELKEGDLVFFHTRGRKSAITHVGVYLTNNKFVHASTSNGVSISDLDESYWKPRFRAGGRMVIPQ